MGLTVADMAAHEERRGNVLGVAVLAGFCFMALISQVITCCMWAVLALFGFDAFDEE